MFDEVIVSRKISIKDFDKRFVIGIYGSPLSGKKTFQNHLKECYPNITITLNNFNIVPDVAIYLYSSSATSLARSIILNSLGLKVDFSYSLSLEYEEFYNKLINYESFLNKEAVFLANLRDNKKLCFYDNSSKTINDLNYPLRPEYRYQMVNFAVFGEWSLNRFFLHSKTILFEHMSNNNLCQSQVQF